MTNLILSTIEQSNHSSSIEKKAFSSIRSSAIPCLLICKHSPHNSHTKRYLLFFCHAAKAHSHSRTMGKLSCSVLYYCSSADHDRARYTVLCDPKIDRPLPSFFLLLYRTVVGASRVAKKRDREREREREKVIEKKTKHQFIRIIPHYSSSFTSHRASRFPIEPPRRTTILIISIIIITIVIVAVVVVVGVVLHFQFTW